MTTLLIRATAPVTAVIFIALTLVSFLAGPSTPNSKATGAHVIAVFSAHRHAERVTDILGVFAFLFLVFFAATLRGYLRRAPGAEAGSALVMAGAILMAAGFTMVLGIDYALTDVPSRLSPAAAQAMNVLDNDVFFTVLIGGCVFGIGAGIAVLRGATLPNWLGWLAILIGIAAVTPAFFPALLVLLAWVLIVSILIYQRSANTPTPTLTEP